MPGAKAAVQRFDPSQWIPLFRRITPKSRFLTLPPQIVCALLDNSLILPDTETTVEWSDGSLTVSETTPTPGVDAVLTQLDDLIEELDGAVLPKLGQKAPSDAIWTNTTRTMKCESAFQVITMLQSSERVVAAGGSAIVLRKWATLDERREYRCFVRAGQMVGICTRGEMHVEYSQDEMDAIVSKIEAFHRDNIATHFETDDYVLDIYMDSSDRVWLIDFAEWCQTEPLLFNWDELRQLQVSRAQFRCGVRVGVSVSNQMVDGLPLELRDSRFSNLSDLIDAARELSIRGDENANEDT